MFVVIDGFGGLEADPLDCVRLVASALGIQDVDVEPWAGEKVTIHSAGGSVTGPNMAEACKMFLDKLLNRCYTRSITNGRTS